MTIHGNIEYEFRDHENTKQYRTRHLGEFSDFQWSNWLDCPKNMEYPVPLPDVSLKQNLVCPVCKLDVKIVGGYVEGHFQPPLKTSTVNGIAVSITPSCPMNGAVVNKFTEIKPITNPATVVDSSFKLNSEVMAANLKDSHVQQSLIDLLTATEPKAVVAYIERNDRILCVWNKVYGGWSMPGGKVEPSESLDAALIRELHEETSLSLQSLNLLYTDYHNTSHQTRRGTKVHVYYVEATGEPRQCEDSSPVTWLTKHELLQWSPFREFYIKMFASWNRCAVCGAMPHQPCDTGMHS